MPGTATEGLPGVFWIRSFGPSTSEAEALGADVVIPG